MLVFTCLHTDSRVTTQVKCDKASIFSLCTDPNFDASIIPMTQQLLLFVLEGEIGPDLSLMLNLKPIQICRRQRKGQGSGSWGRIMHPKLCIS